MPVALIPSPSFYNAPYPLLPMPPNPSPVLLNQYVQAMEASALARWSFLAPWELTSQSEAIVRQLISELDDSEFDLAGSIAVHKTSTVETGAVLKGPLIIGPRCFIATGAYLRGGNWVAQDCSLGPGVELKSSFVFERTKLAHLNFVGDSVLGSDVNLEAGSIICNHRNERDDKHIWVRQGQALLAIGCEKFGALVGDHCRIGANAVIAPGAILQPNTIVGRTSLVDQEESQT